MPTTDCPCHETALGVLSRDAIKNGILQRLFASSCGPRVCTEEELHASVRETLAGHEGQDIWPFAYGSPIWNPAFMYVERCIARIHGLRSSLLFANEDRSWQSLSSRLRARSRSRRLLSWRRLSY